MPTLPHAVYLSLRTCVGHALSAFWYGANVLVTDDFAKLKHMPDTSHFTPANSREPMRCVAPFLAVIFSMLLMSTAFAQKVVQVSSSANHVLALREDGTVWAWGSNSSGQLGDSTNVNRTAPVQVVGLGGVVEVAAGNSHSLARKTDGTVWAWGSNLSGELGDGTLRTARSEAKPVLGLAYVVQLRAYSQFNTAKTSDSDAWAWGSSVHGSLPARAASLANVATIGATNRTRWRVWVTEHKEPRVGASSLLLAMAAQRL